MPEVQLRELAHEDLDALVDYWHFSSVEHLRSMGVDPEKRPPPLPLRAALRLQLATALRDRSSYCLIAARDSTAIGHINLNPFVFGEVGTLHMHLWSAQDRGRGIGRDALAQALDIFFARGELLEIRCQPFAENHAANRVLSHLGFEFVEALTCIPFAMAFEQKVNTYRLHAEHWRNGA
jgi:RimJ/RimL family protein N-acetyltransferase